MGKKPSYAVGKGKPPKRTQFKKGQSGNPGGRPKPKPGSLMQARLKDAIEQCLAADLDDLRYKHGAWEDLSDPLLIVARDLVMNSVEGGERATKLLLSLMEKLDGLPANEQPNADRNFSLSEGKAEGSGENPDPAESNMQADQGVEADAAAGSGNASGNVADDPDAPPPPRPPHQKPIIRIGGRLIQDGY